MTYDARHRKPVHRGKARAVTVALALAGTTLAAPLTTTNSVQATTVLNTGSVPPWLRAPDIAINPAGPAAGQFIAPAVKRGYVITGDQLAKYDITSTAAAQTEIRAFVAEVAQRGRTVNPASVRAYATPPIQTAQAAGLIKTLNDAVVDLTDWIITPNLIDWDEVNATLNECLDIVRNLYLMGVDPGVDPQTIITLLNTVLDVVRNLYLNGITPGNLDIDPIVATAQALIGSGPATVTAAAQAVIAEAQAIVGSLPTTPPDVQPILSQVVTEVQAIIDAVNIDQLLDSVGLPPSSDVEADPSHAAPVGTDPVTDVYDGVLGDVLVLPVGVGVGTVGAVWDEGMLKVSTTLETTPLASLAPVVDGLAQKDPGESAEWDPAGGNGCMRRKSNNTAWYDPCAWWYELAKDGNKDRRTWGLKHYGTAKSKGIWNLTHFEARSWRKTGTADQDWIDWSPRADDDKGHCTSQTVGVNVNAAYLEQTSQHCEQWDIDKGEEPADFANTWWGNVNRHEREVAAVVSTSTPNGYLPYDMLRYNYYAR